MKDILVALAIAAGFWGFIYGVIELCAYISHSSHKDTYSLALAFIVTVFVSLGMIKVHKAGY